jgi:hypothetical protein
MVVDLLLLEEPDGVFFPKGSLDWSFGGMVTY